MSSRNSLPPFLRKTWGIVSDENTNSLISWNATGTSFIIWRPVEFSRDILPAFFKHSNLSSFVRQLNTYGFRKVDPDRWEFANEYFRRDQQELLQGIIRRKPSTTATPCHGSHNSQHHTGISSSNNLQQQHPANQQQLIQQPVMENGQPGVDYKSFPGQPAGLLPMPYPLDLNSGLAVGAPLNFGPSTSQQMMPAIMPNGANMPHGAMMLPSNTQAASVPQTNKEAMTPSHEQIQTQRLQCSSSPIMSDPGSNQAVNASSNNNINQDSSTRTNALLDAVAFAQKPPTQLDIAPLSSPTLQLAQPSLQDPTGQDGSRLQQLLQDYLRPGQQVLASIASGASNTHVGNTGMNIMKDVPMQPGPWAGGPLEQLASGMLPSSIRGQPSCSDTSGTAVSNGPAVSGNNERTVSGGRVTVSEDTEEASKAIKRSRGQLYNQAASNDAANEGGNLRHSPGPAHGSTSNVQSQLPDLLPVNTHRQPVLGTNQQDVMMPSRPVPQSMPQVTQSLLAEMATQLHALSALEAENKELRAQNMQLRQDASSRRGDAPGHVNSDVDMANGTPEYDRSTDNAGPSRNMEVAQVPTVSGSGSGTSLSGGRADDAANQISSGKGSIANTSQLEAMLQDHQERFWALKLKNDAVELEMAAQKAQSAVQRERTAALEAQLAVQAKASLDTVELAKSLQMALAVQNSTRVAADEYSRNLEARLAAQEKENDMHRQTSAALHAKIAQLEQQLAAAGLVQAMHDPSKALNNALVAAAAAVPLPSSNGTVSGSQTGGASADMNADTAASSGMATAPAQQQ